MIDYEYQDKDKFILNNSLSYSKWNQRTDMIVDTDPPIMGKLDNGNWVYQNPIPFLEDINNTEPLQ